MRRIYLDHNATTPLHPRVRDAMSAWLNDGAPANPSSLHAEGRAARRALEDARDQVADALGTTADRITFTSGATEANHLALRGLHRAGGAAPRRVAISAIEHPSVRALEDVLPDAGVSTERIPVDHEGQLSLAGLDSALERGAGLIAVMAANNEVGTLQPVAQIAKRCADHGALFHCDAAQWVGKAGLRVDDLRADSVALSAHKLGGPTGIGALWTRETVRVAARLVGGGQERGRRAGTENVGGAIGFGAAMATVMEEHEARRERLRTLEADFRERLLAEIPGLIVNGPPPEKRLPGTLNLRFPGVFGEPFLFALDLAGIAASLGSACSSGAARPSHVLEAMGLGKGENLQSLRFSFGAHQPFEEAAHAARRVIDVWAQHQS